MWPVMIVLALLVSAEVDSLTARHVRAAMTKLDSGGLLVTTEGDSVARARVTLKRDDTPCGRPNAYFMSLGPLAPWTPDTSSAPFHLVDEHSRMLRVMLLSAENDRVIVIDDILLGRADSRTVTASYLCFPYGLTDLWRALPGTRRIAGPVAEGPPIVWRSPTAFRWIARADTLDFEQLEGANFLVTLRARVR